MPSKREERIGREAAQWVVLFDSPSFKPPDVRAFRRWLDRAPEHRPAFQLASRAWNQLDLLSKLEDYPLPAGESGVSRRALVGGGTAGAVALAAAGYAVFNGASAKAYETGIGEVRSVALGDGTHITLNAGTRIETMADAGERHVRILRGEALFAIAPQSTGPFVISTMNGDIAATSGEVLVKILPEGARVSAISGTVRTTDKGSASGATLDAAAGDEITFNASSPVLSHPEAPLLPRRTLWKEGRLAFDDTPLPEALDDISRQTGAHFALANISLAALRVSGLINARDLPSFLTLLRENLGIESTLRSDGVLVLTFAAQAEPSHEHPLP